MRPAGSNATQRTTAARGVAVGALAVVVSGCPRAPVRPLAVPAAGISIAVYASGTTSVAVIDDRRWVDLAGPSILLDRIDYAAALPSLVIESLAGGPLIFGACTRERLDRSPQGLSALVASQRVPAPGATTPAGSPPGEPPPATRVDVGDSIPAGVLSPLVRCAVAAPAGRYLVRVLYVISTLGYRTQHDVSMTSADRAVVATRFAVATPRWQARGELVLYAGLPGGDEPPRELARGPATLDGGIAILALPPRDVAARLRTIYDGMVQAQTVEPTVPGWGKDSHHSVWVWLELAGLVLAPGPVHAHVETPDGVRDIDVPADARDRDADTTRVPVWVDGTLRGMRRRWVERPDGATLADRFQLSVSNLGEVPREVWIEERLRPARRRELGRGGSIRPTITGKVARTRLVLPPGKTERLGFTITYEL